MGGGVSSRQAGFALVASCAALLALCALQGAPEADVSLATKGGVGRGGLGGTEGVRGRIKVLEREEGKVEAVEAAAKTLEACMSLLLAPPSPPSLSPPPFPPPPPPPVSIHPMSDTSPLAPSPAPPPSSHLWRPAPLPLLLLLVPDPLCPLSRRPPASTPHLLSTRH